MALGNQDLPFFQSLLPIGLGGGLAQVQDFPKPKGPHPGLANQVDAFPRCRHVAKRGGPISQALPDAFPDGVPEFGSRGLPGSLPHLAKPVPERILAGNLALEAGKIQVAMGVDQAGQEHRVAQVQNPRRGVKGHLLAPAHLENPVPFQQHESVLQGTVPVEGEEIFCQKDQPRRGAHHPRLSAPGPLLQPSLGVFLLG
jgi:hypothetical protein